jgi:hypothetical protein
VSGQPQQRQQHRRRRAERADRCAAGTVLTVLACLRACACARVRACVRGRVRCSEIIGMQFALLRGWGLSKYPTNLRIVAVGLGEKERVLKERVLKERVLPSPRLLLAFPPRVFCSPCALLPSARLASCRHTCRDRRSAEPLAARSCGQARPGAIQDRPFVVLHTAAAATAVADAGAASCSLCRA